MEINKFYATQLGTGYELKNNDFDFCTYEDFLNNAMIQGFKKHKDFVSFSSYDVGNIVFVMMKTKDIAGEIIVRGFEIGYTKNPVIDFPKLSGRTLKFYDFMSNRNQK